MNNNWLRLVLVCAILIVINAISDQLSFRIDMTEDQRYTLSDATLDILQGLEEPVTVKAYFSENLPTNVSKTREDFRNLLIEYSNRSNGMLDYTFINPSEAEESQQALMRKGIRPVMINVREKDQVKQQRAWLGAVIEMGDRSDVIPFLQPGTAMEYNLTTSIKKVSVVDKPSVGIVQGHGEPGLDQLSQLRQKLQVLYDVQTLQLAGGDISPEQYRSLLIISPNDSFPQQDLSVLDNYLSAGGRLCMAIDAVEGDFQRARGSAVTTGLESWLPKWGIGIEPVFVVDARCGRVSVRQQQGGFSFNTSVQFPYMPKIQSFPDHPVTKGLEQVMFQLASPLEFTGDTNSGGEILVTSSSKAGTVSPPLTFDVANKQWQNSDFPESNIPMGLARNIPGGGRLAVFSDGEFVVSGQGRRSGQSEDNISLMANTVDWLSDDTGLIALRTKGVETRPIKEVSESRRSFLKWLNFLLPLAIVLFYGVGRYQWRQRQRNKRMQESYA